VGGAVIGLHDLGAIERYGRELCGHLELDDETVVARWRSFVRTLATRRRAG